MTYQRAADGGAPQRSPRSFQRRPQYALKFLLGAITTLALLATGASPATAETSPTEHAWTFGCQTNGYAVSTLYPSILTFHEDPSGCSDSVHSMACKSYGGANHCTGFVPGYSGYSSAEITGPYLYGWGKGKHYNDGWSNTFQTDIVS